MVARSPLIWSCCFLWTSSAFTMESSTRQPPPEHLVPTTTSRLTRFMSSSVEEENNSTPEPPLYIKEGLFAVDKPLGWTSQQVVGRVRSLLEKDAKARGVVDNRKKRRRPWMKVGHGGTLDPLASGVLVVGVGKGTKSLQKYLTGSKGYKAGVELGFQTTTLDLDENGEIVGKMPFDHVTWENVESTLDGFRGTIQQKPPIFSALKKDGKRMYELGRKGVTAEDIEIEAREVVIHRLELLKEESEEPKTFGLDVECGGGTYIRSLVRDIGISLDTLATMTSLERTKQGPYLPEHCLKEDDWTAENIFKAIEETSFVLVEEENDDEN
ncbi:unnamed protein product [Cylindrotheca closterium]|uniref:tRNA pseudouridine(55) synthase n=1 Tax=Cylindrotheca closterium TaxID=2856 RepID=A0AAD2G0E5_9STRA|nr:unnamed protein product [Cylindrotheca closterium]